MKWETEFMVKEQFPPSEDCNSLWIEKQIQRETDTKFKVRKYHERNAGTENEGYIYCVTVFGFAAERHAFERYKLFETIKKSESYLDTYVSDDLGELYDFIEDVKENIEC